MNFINEMCNVWLMKCVRYEWMKCMYQVWMNEWNVSGMNEQMTPIWFWPFVWENIEWAEEVDHKFQYYMTFSISTGIYYYYYYRISIVICL